MCIFHGRIAASEYNIQALVRLTTGTDRQSRVESKQIFSSLSQHGRNQSLHAWLQFYMNNILSYKKKGRIKQFCHFCRSIQLFSQEI